MPDDNAPVVKVEFAEDGNSHTTRIERYDPTSNHDLMPVASFLDVRMTNKASEQIKGLISEVKASNKDASTGDVFQYIRNLESRLGPPARGETRLNRISRYLALHSKAKEYEKRRDAMLQ